MKLLQPVFTAMSFIQNLYRMKGEYSVETVKSGLTNSAVGPMEKIMYLFVSSEIKSWYLK